MIDLKELEELLQREEVSSQPKRKYKKGENRDVIKFIRKNGIAPGDKKVPTYVIYYHFIKWCKPTWTKLWGKEEFFRTFKKYFQQKRSGNQRFYMINDVLDLSEELYEKAKKYNTKHQKRPHTKRPRKVPSPE